MKLAALAKYSSESSVAMDREEATAPVHLRKRRRSNSQVIMRSPRTQAITGPR